jgi:hypothetical protein
MRCLHVLFAMGLAVGGLLLSPAPAAARVSFGFGFGFPLVSPYPAYPVYPYYPPPAYYYPPPAYYYPPAPPPAYAPYAYVPPAAARQCHAGSLSCPLVQPAQPGDACNCATPRGQAWGRAGE